MVTTGSVSEHLAPGLFGIVGTRLGGRQSYFSRYYNIHTSRRNYEDWLYATGLPIAVEKPQGTNIPSFDIIEGSTKRLTHTVYAIGMEITEEASDDDLYAGQGSAITEGTQNIADSIAERIEIEAHRPFTAEGFDGSTFTVLPDSSGFFATSHAPITGGQGVTQNNRPSTNADLNTTSLQTAVQTFMQYKDDQGKRIPGAWMPRALEHPPQLMHVVKELLGSPTRVDQANPNVINTLGGIQNPGPNPYLSDDADAWMLRGNKLGTHFLWRWRPRMDAFDDRRARVAIFVVYVRFSYAPVTWQGWYGSPGE